MANKKESLRSRAQEIFKILKKTYPDAKCSLTYHNPHELLIATILSAQCTDERVNIVTLDLFKKFTSTISFAKAELSQLEQDIRSTGFYHNKAKNIKAACQLIVEKYQGQVPRTMDELLSLPGVARKTANVVLGNAFGIAVGVVVDTHVNRLTRRMGLTKEKMPEKIEQDLMKLLKQNQWVDFSHILIFHGRKVCSARKPECGVCPVEKYCPKLFS